jgi:hypothetical protein
MPSGNPDRTAAHCHLAPAHVDSSGTSLVNQFTLVIDQSKGTLVNLNKQIVANCVILGSYARISYTFTYSNSLRTTHVKVFYRFGPA